MKGACDRPSNIPTLVIVGLDVVTQGNITIFSFSALYATIQKPTDKMMSHISFAEASKSLHL